MKKLNNTEIQIISEVIFNDLKKETEQKLKVTTEQSKLISGFFELQIEANKHIYDMIEIAKALNVYNRYSFKEINIDIRKLFIEKQIRRHSITEIKKEIILSQIEATNLNQLIETVKNKFRK